MNLKILHQQGLLGLHNLSGATLSVAGDRPLLSDRIAMPATRGTKGQEPWLVMGQQQRTGVRLQQPLCLFNQKGHQISHVPAGQQLVRQVEQRRLLMDALCSQ